MSMRSQVAEALGALPCHCAPKDMPQNDATVAWRKLACKTKLFEASGRCVSAIQEGRPRTPPGTLASNGKNSSRAEQSRVEGSRVEEQSRV